MTMKDEITIYKQIEIYLIRYGVNYPCSINHMVIYIKLMLIISILFFLINFNGSIFYDPNLNFLITMDGIYVIMILLCIFSNFKKQRFSRKRCLITIREKICKQSIQKEYTILFA